MTRPKLVILDRDGVLNRELGAYVTHPGEFEIQPGSPEAVAALNKAGIATAVATNQGGVGRGLYSEAMLNTIHDKLRDEVAKAGGKLDLILFAPDHPENPGPRRKPNPGMLEEALRHFGCAAGDAVMIGDSLRDLEAAARLGMPRILVRSGNGTKTQADGLPDHVLPVRVFDDLKAAIDSLLSSDP